MRYTNSNIDQDFDRIIWNKVLPGIAEAFCNLGSEMFPERMMAKVLPKKAEKAKSLICRFIDAQVTYQMDFITGPSIKEVKSCITHHTEANSSGCVFE